MAELLAIVGWILAAAAVGAWWRAVDRIHWAESRAEALEEVIESRRWENRPCPWPEAHNG